MKKSFVFFAIFFTAVVFAAEIPILELDKWKFTNISAEVSGKSLRMRENGPQAYGTAKRRVVVGKNKYIQIIAGASENPDHYLSVSNVSSRKQPDGVIFQGVNTFPLKDKNFTIALTLRGKKGTIPAGWCDINSIRTVDKPLGGLTVSSDKKCVASNDTFTVKYYATQKLAADAAEVKTFLASSMSSVSFGSPIILNDDGKNGDEKANDLIYSAQVKVSNKAHNIGKSAVLFAITLPDGSSSYGTADFSFDVKTARTVQKTLTRLTPLAVKYRAMWDAATTGRTNLAAGKKVEFSIAPNFYLTRSGRNKNAATNDPWDLTDGKLSVRGDDVLRFDSNAVGWRTGADLSGGIDLTVDLGKVEPVEKVVIRVNCGDRNKQVQRSPRKFAVLVSKDGSYFYPAAREMIKLQPGEKDQSNFVDQFYLEENDQDIFCFPFELKVNANARYITVRIVPDGGNLYTDEMAIIKADDPAKAVSQAYSAIPEKRLIGGVVLTPAQSGRFFVAENIPAPNYFSIRDLRENPPVSAMQLVMELPANIRCLNKEFKQEKFKRNDTDFVRYIFNLPNDSKKTARFLEHQGIFLQASGNIPAGSKAYFYALVNQKKSHVIERDIESITIPESHEMFKGITVLSRMGIGDDTFPGFFDNLKKMGFSGVQIYPYMFQRRGTDNFTEEYCQLVDNVRKNGYQLVFGYNGLLDMYRYSKHKNAVYCQNIPQKNVKCPTYRGEHYHAELAKITRSVAKFKPDYIQWDIEIWGHSMKYLHNCSRCKGLKEKSGKNWEDFLDDVSVELNSDLNKAVAKGVKKANCTMPQLYNYNRQKLSKSYHGFEKWSLNGKFVDGSQPSLYVAGNEMRVHNNIKGNFDLQKDRSKRKIVPVLTPGTYGAYEPFHLEQMIYETMLNGAKGFCYYPWRGFISPIYFYYHAKAMKNVIKYQDLILQGTIYTPVCGNKDMIVSGVKNEREALILIGNYQRSKAPVKLTAPFENARIYDVSSGKYITFEAFKKLSVEPARCKLLHFSKK